MTDQFTDTLLVIAVLFCLYQWINLLALLITYYGLPKIPFIERIKRRRAEKRWAKWWASLPADRQRQIIARAEGVGDVVRSSCVTADQAASALRGLSRL